MCVRRGTIYHFRVGDMEFIIKYSQVLINLH